MTTMKDARQRLHDRRVKEIKPLIPPQILLEDIPLTLRAADTVLNARSQTEAILRGDDDRLMVVVGYVLEHLSRCMTRHTRFEIHASFTVRVPFTTFKLA
jgi:phospho-2-dehydro-3-deoxyheptonate aldolase